MVLPVRDGARQYNFYLLCYLLEMEPEILRISTYLEIFNIIVKNYQESPGQFSEYVCCKPRFHPLNAI